MRSPEEQLEDEVAVLKRRLEASEAQAASRLEEIESLLESLRVQQDRTRAAREALRPEVTGGWISVEERLPEARYGEAGKPPVVSEDVLVCGCNALGDEHIVFANYDHEAKQWWVIEGHGHLDADDPTHWMPKPKLPKVVLDYVNAQRRKLGYPELDSGLPQEPEGK